MQAAHGPCPCRRPAARRGRARARLGVLLALARHDDRRHRVLHEQHVLGRQRQRKHQPARLHAAAAVEAQVCAPGRGRRCLRAQLGARAACPASLKLAQSAACMQLHVDRDTTLARRRRSARARSAARCLRAQLGARAACPAALNLAQSAACMQLHVDRDTALARRRRSARARSAARCLRAQLGARAACPAALKPRPKRSPHAATCGPRHRTRTTALPRASPGPHMYTGSVHHGYQAPGVTRGSLLPGNRCLLL